MKEIPVYWIFVSLQAWLLSLHSVLPVSRSRRVFIKGSLMATRFKKGKLFWMIDCDFTVYSCYTCLSFIRMVIIVRLAYFRNDWVDLFLYGLLPDWEQLVVL